MILLMTIASLAALVSFLTILAVGGVMAEYGERRGLVNTKQVSEVQHGKPTD